MRRLYVPRRHVAVDRLCVPVRCVEKERGCMCSGGASRQGVCVPVRPYWLYAPVRHVGSERLYMLGRRAGMERLYVPGRRAVARRLCVLGWLVERLCMHVRRGGAAVLA